VETTLKEATNIDGVEHGITFGRDENGQITQAPMRDGGVYNVPVTQNWPGAFASVHNHVANTPLSTGDIYSAIKLISNNPNFTTSYINLPDGSSYSIVVTDLALAQNFIDKYPADQIPGYSPEFPDAIHNELQDLKDYFGFDLSGRTNALAYILQKYDAGLQILKEDDMGNYDAITVRIKENLDGSKTYEFINCP
ncbi:hypothetical protein B6A10_16275, partial [Flavobacterium sp. L1I52]